MNWGYITGFFDADGSITAIRKNKNTNKTIQVSFHNSERDILEEIRDFIFEELSIKGNISIKKAKKESHKDSFDLKYVNRAGHQLIQMLETIHPKKKHRKQIYNLIQEKTKRNGKYSEEELKEREDLLETFFQIK